MLIGCSSSNEQTKDENTIPKEEYVFDASGVDSTSNEAPAPSNSPVSEPIKKYIVQIGALTTKASAEDFALKAKKILSKEVIVSYSEELKLYVVQLPPLSTYAEARTVRDRLWKSKDYKDAFIVVP